MCEKCKMVDRIGKEIVALGSLVTTRELTDADFERVTAVLREHDEELTVEMLRGIGADTLTMLIAVRCAVAAGAVYDDSPSLSIILGQWAGQVLETEASVITAMALTNFTPGQMN